MNDLAKETWSSGEAYERWVGRWSRAVAAEFLAWLRVPTGQAWGDVGCGTGVLTERILAACEPSSVDGIDRCDAFIAAARDKIKDPRVRFEVGDALALPWPDRCCDLVVSGLVLNFVAQPEAMVREMQRVTRPGGRVAAYVWDYSGGMQMVRHFWDVAIELRPHDAELDQAERFPICRPDALRTLFADAGLDAVAVRAVDVPMHFRDFDDYWQPFLGNQGAAPTYLAGLDAAAREGIREALRARLVAADDGSIAMSARAWTVQGSVGLLANSSYAATGIARSGKAA